MKLHELNKQRIRYRNYINLYLAVVSGMCIISLAIFGAYALATSYITTEGRVAEAQADTQKVLDYLNGEKVEIEKAGDTYGYRYTVKKELVQLKAI